MSISAPEAAGGQLVTSSEPFLLWLGNWQSNLKTLDLRQYLEETDTRPEEIAVISADLVEGFCYNGPLASPRVGNIVERSAELFRRVYDLGVRNFALAQEYHTHDAPEFEQFGPHCIRDTEEAETVNALSALPFSSLFTVIHKNSLNPALHTNMGSWLAERPEVSTFITVGDCTDLCMYQLVMHLKLNANAEGKPCTVLVPENCVQTYDLPLETAESIGAMPHPGDLLHAIFLYHMALNGALVVKGIV